MREKALLGEDTIRDIYKRNYDDGGFDEVEFGKIVAEYQYGKFLSLLCEEVEKIENHYDKRRLSQGVWWGGDTWRSEGFEDCRQKVLFLLRGDKEEGRCQTK